MLHNVKHECNILILSTDKAEVWDRFLVLYCSVSNVSSRAQYDWLGRMSPLTLLFLTASDCSDLPIIHW